MKTPNLYVLVQDIVELLNKDIIEQGELAWAIRHRSKEAQMLHLGHQNEAITILNFIENHSECPPEPSCKGCKWKDNNEYQLTNKYVLCPFCTRYYKDRFER